jgi:lysyl-tRNA synthetase class 2
MPIYRQTSLKANLELRSRLTAAIRAFFEKEEFLEIETPVRIPAPAPETHIDARESGDWYLQTSPELCMKRLLAAGYERIFQICRCFRREERGRRHLPEMTLLEWYAAVWDYENLMEQCERLFSFLGKALGNGSQLTYQGHQIDLTLPWERLCVDAAFRRYTDLTAEQALAQGRFDEIMGIQIEPQLGLNKPVFLYDYPAACGALARLKPSDPTVAERFELYVAGLELCNAFSELSDPEEQRERFRIENRLREKQGKQAYPTAEPFLKALADMPPAAGSALGLDRLTMLFCNTASIDEVVAFIPEEL